MNIAFVVPNDYQNIGGEYLIINNYSRILNQKGYSVHLVTFPYKFTNNECKADYSKKLYAVIEDDKCEVVITYALNISAMVIPLLDNRFDGKKISFMVDSMTLYSESLIKYESVRKKRILENVKRIVYSHREKRCIEFFDSILYVSAIDKQYAISKFGHSNKIQCIPNGTQIPSEEYARNGTDPLVLGMFTGMSDETANNNLFPFLEGIFPHIVAKYPSIKLYIAGRGASEKTKKRILRQKNVVFLGEVDTLEEFYNKIDVSIITVKKECGVINRVLEGWAYNKVVLGFTRNFLAFEYAIDGKHYLVANNTDEFCTQIGALIDSKELRNRIADNGRAMVEKRYTWEVSADKLISIIER